MAIFRPGPIIGAISGNIGGVAFVTSAKGTIARQPRRRTKSRSASIQQTQSDFTALTQDWSLTNDSTRAAWNEAAISFTTTNRLGLSVHISGFQLWMKYRFFSIFPPDPPNFLPPIMVRQPGVEFTTSEAFVGGPFTIQMAPIAPTSYNRIEVWASRPFTNRPRKFVRFKKLGFSYSPITTTTDIFFAYAPIFGTPILSETIAFRCIAARTGFIPADPVDSIVTVQP